MEEIAEEVQISHGCGNVIIIAKIWTPGGVSDYGGYVLRCHKCNMPLEFYLGRDINESRVLVGADILDTYDDEIGDKAGVLAKHGLSGPTEVSKAPSPTKK
jgi:hypothetical protein